jgi:hypothetical protein
MARRRGILSPSYFIRRAGIYKGLLGGSKGWLAAGGVFWGARFIKKTFGRSEEFAASEVLKPGQFITIEALLPPTRKERKATKRASR